MGIQNHLKTSKSKIMKITAFSLIAAASLVSASPVFKRQDASSTVASAVESASSAVESAVESATSSAASAAMPSGSATPSDFGAGLLAALRDRQATTLATLLEPLADQLVPTLSEGEWTIFAPGNEYLAQVPESITSDQALLARVLQYHIASGIYPVEALMENMTEVATTLASADMLGENYTTLPLPFVKNQFGTTELIGQNATVLANSTYENILIKLIDGVLTIPADVPTVASSNGAEVLVNTLTQLLPDVAGTLANTSAITLFAPNDEAVSAVADTLTSLPADQITPAIQQHVLPGVYYSPNISDGLSLPTLAGNQMMFTVNETGVFVMVGDAGAQVVDTDYQASNGVVHYLDRVLVSLPESAAAPSASMSAMESEAEDGASSVADATSSIAEAASSATEAVASAVPTSA